MYAHKSCYAEKEYEFRKRPKARGNDEGVAK